MKREGVVGPQLRSQVAQKCRQLGAFPGRGCDLRAVPLGLR